MNSTPMGLAFCGKPAQRPSGIRNLGFSRRNVNNDGRLFPLSRAAKRYSKSIMRSRSSIVRASYGGASGEDPYKVLGLPTNATSEQLSRVYRNKLRDAKGNDSETARIENAHTAIMMQFFSRRSKGGESIPKEVKFADRAVYFPWRPRRNTAERKIILITAALQSLFALYGVFVSTAGNQPILAATSIGFVANLFKQNQLYPVASGFDASDKDKRQGVRNLVRSGRPGPGSHVPGVWPLLHVS
eukprot:jgi/Botrbrau1/16795/Bobra.150_2s0024.1